MRYAAQQRSSRTPREDGALILLFSLFFD